MKTTTKKYQEQTKLRSQLRSWVFTFEKNQKWGAKLEAEEAIAELDHLYFNQLETVNVSFMIGYRSYYRAVVKIGKSYYSHYEKMTKSRGYRAIEEIEEITEKMNEAMIDDSYYY